MGSIPIVSTVAGIVVVGASLAGLRACETLRSEGYDGEITVVGAEPDAFYDRPPLSKRYLAGEWESDRIALRRREAIDDLGLSVRTATRATALATGRREVILDDGTVLPWDGVIVATGSAPRSLSIPLPAAGVHVLRTLRDAGGLRSDVGVGRRLVVVGAGFVGLEAAATATTLGASVTVVESAEVPLQRALGSAVGAAIGEVHRRNGVDLRCGASLESILGDDVVRGVVVDGEEIGADAVLVGVGAAPATEWLAESGLQLRDGVVCDAALRARDHDGATVERVYAAGDVARWPHRLYADAEPDVRVEHWTNAAEQGALAARNLLAEIRGVEPEPCVSVPFFWSDQFDARLQFLGRAVPGAEVEIVAGSPASGRFCAAYYRKDVLRGVLGVSMPRHAMPTRPLLERGATRADASAHFAGIA